MNPQEQQRVIVLTQVVSQTMTVAEAAVPMSVCERQTKRILVGFRREGVSVPELSRNPVIIS